MTFPPERDIKVGTARIACCSAAAALSSTSIFTKRIFASAFAAAMLEKVGAMALHGPHQDAVK